MKGGVPHPGGTARIFPVLAQYALSGWLGGVVVVSPLSVISGFLVLDFRGRYESKEIYSDKIR